MAVVLDLLAAVTADVAVAVAVVLVMTVATFMAVKMSEEFFYCCVVLFDLTQYCLCLTYIFHANTASVRAMYSW